VRITLVVDADRDDADLLVAAASQLKMRLVEVHVARDGWLQRHPECRNHPSGLHDALQDPNGCGHCKACHDQSDVMCGHWAGCPGC
jgi:hypothetical protein